jgi:hypothetical protein
MRPIHDKHCRSSVLVRTQTLPWNQDSGYTREACSSYAPSLGQNLTRSTGPADKAQVRYAESGDRAHQHGSVDWYNVKRWTLAKSDVMAVFERIGLERNRHSLGDGCGRSARL